MALLDGKSQIDRAMEDTLVCKADELFDSLVSMYGLPRPSWAARENWRKAVLCGNVAKRDALGTIYALLREGLRQFDATYTVKMDPAVSKTRIYWVAGGPSPGFVQQDLFRFWEIDGKTYWSVLGDGVYGAAQAQVVTVTFSTWTWFNEFIDAADNFVYSYTAQIGQPISNIIVAQSIRDQINAHGKMTAVLVGNVLTVTANVAGEPIQLIDISSTQIGVANPISVIATTTPNVPYGGAFPYLELTPYTAPMWKGCDWSKDASTPSGQWTNKTVKRLPFIMRGHDAQVEIYVQDFSPAPPTYLQMFWDWHPDVIEFLAPYMSEEVVLDAAATLYSLHITEGADSGGVPARGGAYTATVYLNGIATALTCSLAANGTTASDEAHTVNAAKGDKLTVVVSAGGGVNVPLTFPTLSVFKKPPTGEPAGGNLLGGAAKDDPLTGPWPIYLGGDVEDKDLYLVVENMVAMGVAVSTLRKQFLNGA